MLCEISHTDVGILKFRQNALTKIRTRTAIRRLPVPLDHDIDHSRSEMRAHFGLFALYQSMLARLSKSACFRTNVEDVQSYYLNATTLSIECFILRVDIHA